LVGALVVSSSSGMANLATTVLLSDAAAAGALCLDGSAPRCVALHACTARWIPPLHALTTHKRHACRYWIQPSPTGSAKWYVHLMGGGWCESVSDCAARGYATNCYRGSSNPPCLAAEAPGNGLANVTFNATMDFTTIPSCLAARWSGGLMVNDPARNPVSSAWNKVFVHYW